MTRGKEGHSLGDIVGAAGFAIALITSWLYVAGWSYSYHYFDRFRIPLLLAEIPREHLFVYGGLTLWKNLCWFAGLSALSIAVTAAAVGFRRVLGRGGLVLVAVVSVVALFAAARFLGVTTAAADADMQRETDYRAYPRVTVGLVPGADDDSLTAMLSGGCARLLLSTTDRVFLIAPKRSAPALELNTTVVAWKDIRSLTVSGLYLSCD